MEGHHGGFHRTNHVSAKKIKLVQFKVPSEGMSEVDNTIRRRSFIGSPPAFLLEFYRWRTTDATIFYTFEYFSSLVSLTSVGLGFVVVAYQNDDYIGSQKQITFSSSTQLTLLLLSHHIFISISLSRSGSGVI